MQNQAKSRILCYLFLVASFLFWYRANLASSNGLFVTTTNMQLLYDFYALFPSDPGPPEYRAAPLVNEYSLMHLLAILASLTALSGLYCASLGYRARAEPRWYAVPTVLCLTLLFLSVRLIYGAYSVYG